MPIQLSRENGGKVLIVHVSGKLTKADYEHFVPEFERLVREHGKLQVPFDMTAFHGWGAGALWEDIKFDYKHFADIERVAMVGDQMWQQGMAAFCEPFTTAAIRYFDHSHADEARRWLSPRWRSVTGNGAIRNECTKAHRHREGDGRMKSMRSEAVTMTMRVRTGSKAEHETQKDEAEQAQPAPISS
jgi:hypothetical protein